MAMGRPSNTEQRRGEIVDGLLTVMAERGYDGASVNAIAKAAGLTPGLLHYHFASKQEMLTELVARLSTQLRRRYRERLERAGDDPWARLEAFVDAHLARGADADPRAVSSWVVIAAEATRQPDVRALYTASAQERIDELTELIKAALKHEGRRTRSAKRIALLALGAIEGAYLLSASTEGLLPDGYAAPTLNRMLRAWVNAEP